jgi:histidinol phosphatase-like enzyme
MFGLIIASIINYYETRILKIMKNNGVDLKSVVTCPHCRHQKEETMPTDACQYFYECEKCKTILKPKPGDCCVYCSYGSVPCPPIQENKKCC